MNNSTQGHSV